MLDVHDRSVLDLYGILGSLWDSKEVHLGFKGGSFRGCC